MIFGSLHQGKEQAEESRSGRKSILIRKLSVMMICWKKIICYTALSKTMTKNTNPHNYPKTLRLYTLSPLHIGTGESLSPMDYFIHNERFYRAKQDDVYQLIREKLGSDGLRTYADWVAEQFEVMRELRDNRKQSQLMDSINVLSFFESINKRNVLLDAFKTKRIPIRGDDDNRNRKSGQKRYGEVKEAMRSAGKAYLPGSSIKGALRTALLYSYMKRYGESMNLEGIIRSQLDDRRVRKEYFANPLEEAAFFCEQKIGNKTGSRYVVRKQEAQMDLMKWIGVGDAHLQSEEALQLGKINLYLVEKEQTRERDRRSTPRFYASRQNQSSYVEMIASGQELHSELNVDVVTIITLLKQEQKIDGGTGIRQKSGIYYINLSKKLKRLFNLSDELLKEPTHQALANAILTHCMQAMQDFCKDQLSRQNAWQEDYSSQLDPRKYASRIATGYAPVYAHTGQLMHLGYAAGFNATTILLFFLNRPKYHVLYEKVMDHFQLGRAPRQKGKYTPRISRFPKSRRLVEGENDIRPLGWLAVLGKEEATPSVSANTASEQAQIIEEEEKEAATPAYYTGKLNYRRPPELDAVVVKSGRPNIVKVYLTEDYSPELPLQAYRSPLAKDTVIRVKTQISKKGVLLSANFLKEK